jgi:hypothetical protein
MAALDHPCNDEKIVLRLPRCAVNRAAPRSAERHRQMLRAGVAATRHRRLTALAGLSGWPQRSRVFSCLRITLPVDVLGRSGTNRMERGSLYAARCGRQCSMISASVAAAPGRSTT